MHAARRSLVTAREGPRDGRPRPRPRPWAGCLSRRRFGGCVGTGPWADAGGEVDAQGGEQERAAVAVNVVVVSCSGAEKEREGPRLRRSQSLSVPICNGQMDGSSPAYVAAAQQRNSAAYVLRAQTQQDTARQDRTGHDAGRRGQSARITHHASCDASRLVASRRSAWEGLRPRPRPGREEQTRGMANNLLRGRGHGPPAPLSRLGAFAIPTRPSRWFGRRHGCVNR